MQEFAEDEIVLPDSGQHANEKYRCSYQPFTRLWFDAIASRIFRRYVATGPSQSGKTLTCCVIPACYHLFEVRETVIFFSPKMEINEEKWLIDIKPTIEKSRYAHFLPRSGRGSQGGFSELIVFKNGSRIKFMTGGGGDKNKAAFTSRVAIGTEIDGMDTASKTSRETDPLNQIAARLRSHGSRAVEYLECTVSTESGRVWQEVTKGSNSKIVLQCPHCFHWVTPEREHFIGWESAQTEIEAETLGKFYCPDCGTAWTTEQRKSANVNCKLIHSGQRINEQGIVSGELPQSRTFGFRWSAVNNMFAEESLLGSEEWKSARILDRDAAEKQRCQFVWCIPFTGEQTGIEITEEMVASRLTGIPRGVVPDNVETLVVQVDLHLRWHYWTVLATGSDKARSIVDYGLSINPSPETNGPEVAVRLGLEQLAADLDGRSWKTVSGRDYQFDLKLIDAGYQQEIALEFVTDHPKWRLIKGQGKDFRQPKEKSADVRPGDHWYDSRQPGHEKSNRRKWWLLIGETMYWMRQVHNGFISTTFNEDGSRRPGSIALFGNDSQVHLNPIDKTVARSSFATQILGWKWEASTTPKNGEVMDWVSQWKEDHWFDTTYGCLIADLVARHYSPKFKKQLSAEPKQPAAAQPTPKHFRLFSEGQRPRLS